MVGDPVIHIADSPIDLMSSITNFEIAEAHSALVVEEDATAMSLIWCMEEAKEADLLLQNNELNGNKDHLSQQVYIRGISAWNFNLEDLKNHAALIRDYDENLNVEDPNASSKKQNGLIDVGLSTERSSTEIPIHSDTASDLEDEINEVPNLEDPFEAFLMKPIQALKERSYTRHLSFSFILHESYMKVLVAYMSACEIFTCPTAGDENLSDTE